MTRIYQDHIGGTTDGSLTDSGTTLTSDALAALVAVASPDTMIVILDPDGIAGAPEHVEVTAHTASASTATITRGVNGTTARAHADNVEWVHGLVASDVNYGGMVEIETVELGSDTASISFSDIPDTYRDLVIVGELRSDEAVTNDFASLTMGNGSVDTGTNYRWFFMNVPEDATPNANEQEGQSSIRVAPIPEDASGDTGIFGVLTVQVMRYADSSRRRGVRSDFGMAQDTLSMVSGNTTAVWEDTSDAVDIITFAPENGTNFVTDSYLTLYGRGRA